MEQNEKNGLLKKNGLIYLKGDNEFLKIRANEYCHRIFYKNNAWYYDKCNCSAEHYKKHLENDSLEISTAEVFIGAENMYYDYKQMSNGTTN